MKHRVLVVDDNPKNLQVVAALLSENNYFVEVALSGKNAIKWVEDTKFDAILLDIMMPELSGFETCKIIKETPLNKNVPIIFLTARNDSESIAEGFKVGGVDYISKPFNHSELLIRLSTQIELMHSREKLMDLNRWLQKEVDKKTSDLTFANQELKKANQELKKLDNAKNDFLKSISHEIRTPLNGIIGSMNILKSISKDEFTNEVLELLRSSVNNLEKYSYSALQISNLQLKGVTQLNISNIDIIPIAQDLITRFQNQNNKSQIKFKFINQLDEALVKGDVEFIQNAISSLIDSSVTYTNKGIVELMIKGNDENIEICIKDSGNLFAGDEVSHFFNSITTQNYQFERNNAMELYLAKMIIQLHKGEVNFCNLDDKSGTITTISIPRINKLVYQRNQVD